MTLENLIIMNFLIQIIRTTSIYLKSILLYTYLDDIFSKKFNHQSATLYSFWFDDYSLGASLFKKNNNLKLIIGSWKRSFLLKKGMLD